MGNGLTARRRRRRGGHDGLVLRRRSRPRRVMLHEGFVWPRVRPPAVFFCQNNQWAISEADRAAEPLPSTSDPRLWLPRVRVDGNGRLASLAVSRWARECRHGNVSGLIEAYPYRMDAHDHHRRPTPLPLSLRRAGGVKLKDPIERGPVNLIRHEHADQEFFDEVRPTRTSLAAGAARILREHAARLAAPRRYVSAISTRSPRAGSTPQRDEFLEYVSGFRGGALTMATPNDQDRRRGRVD